MKLERHEGGFSIDASLLGNLLNVPPSHVHALMRQKEITSLCERGEEEHKGQYRLTFYYRGRRVWLSVDESGSVIRRSILDLGDRQPSSTMLGRDSAWPTQDSRCPSAMPQTASHSAMDLSATPGDEHGLPPLPPRPFEREAECQQGNPANGVGIIFVDRILPKARDRLATVGAEAPLTKAAERLFEPRRRMVVVCDDDGAMLGVITRTDIVRQVRHCQGCACTIRCRTMMTKDVISCRVGDRLDRVWTVMRERELHSIPVIDSGYRPIGLLSARDALEALMASVEHEANLLKDYVMCVGYR